MARDGGSIKRKRPEGNFSPRASALDATILGSFFLSAGERVWVARHVLLAGPCGRVALFSSPFSGGFHAPDGWSMNCLFSVAWVASKLFSMILFVIVTIALRLWAVKLPPLAESLI